MSPQAPGVRVIGEARSSPRPGCRPKWKWKASACGCLPSRAAPSTWETTHWPARGPLHTVRVEPFYLGRYEVTQSQKWQAVMGANPSAHRQGLTDNAKTPVESVSWRDCQAFIGKLNARVPGGGFRLPTEAEWEFAARAGGGPSRGPGEVAWYRANSLVRERRDANYTDMAPAPRGARRRLTRSGSTT